jgi:heavy metal translocating P-type ATPase
MCTRIDKTGSDGEMWSRSHAAASSGTLQPFAEREIVQREAKDLLRIALLALAVAGLLTGLAARLYGFDDLARVAWTGGVVPVLAALALEIVGSLRRGEVGLDIVAGLSMSAALFFGEALAAAVVALMYAGGTFLESFAEGRARREMRGLLSRVPRTATRHRNGGLEDVPLDEIAPGDRVLIRQGDVAPVDGTVDSESALLDQSALTGESMPVRLIRGQDVMSGSANVGYPFDLRASHPAAESTYAGIVRLVEEAQRSKAPMSRLADRYSLLFLGVTIALASGAWWTAGDPIRAVAVLVVATPCPLILAVPVALVAGLSRAAHYGVLIKGAQALEAMARVHTLILDKTGTLTDGRPRIVSIHAHAELSENDILTVAAALEQASKHPIALAIVAHARERGLHLPVPSEVIEAPGEGLAGRVNGNPVLVGSPAYVAAGLEKTTVDPPTIAAGAVLVAVAVDGRLAAHIVMADVLREGTTRFLAGLKRVGVRRIVLATGDRRAVAQAVSRDLGLDGVRAELTPDQKVLLVLAERKNGPVMMVGDGVNDAPALAAADIGVAMGARGAAASAEAADVVLLVDRLNPLLPGIEIARGSRRIARESVVAGIGMSIAGMIAAALGYLAPVEGAILQELIDVAVILNALRALRLAPRA